ncbi:CRAL-TRIO domain-containing protein [Melampsora americana]|nr:CRAL-TRIO domain-containing protein [Melampsora americana]
MTTSTSTSNDSIVQALLTTPTHGTQPDPKPHELSESQTKILEQLIEHFSSPDLKLPTHLPISSATEESRKALSHWEKCSLLNREALVRCLKADKWELERCLKRVQETIVWRRECGADTVEIDPQEASVIRTEAETGKMFVLGYDNFARPIVHMRPRFQNTTVTPMRLQFSFWLIDRAIDLMPLGVESVLLLIDLSGPQETPALKQQREFVNILSAYYCERLGQALVLNMPKLFVWVLRLLKPLIDPVTYNKAVFDQPDPLKSAPAEQLDATLGGTNGYTFDIESYWPALMTECQSRRRQRLEQWISTGKTVGSSEWAVDEAKEKEKNEKFTLNQSNSTHLSAPASTPATETPNPEATTVPVTLVIE